MHSALVEIGDMNVCRGIERKSTAAVRVVAHIQKSFLGRRRPDPVNQFKPKKSCGAMLRCSIVPSSHRHIRGRPHFTAWTLPAGTDPIRRALNRIGHFLNRLARTAEQLSVEAVWAIILSVAFVKWL